MAYRRWVLWFLLFVIIQPCVFAREEYSYRVFLEESIVTLEESIVPGSFKISPNGLSYACIVNDKNNFQVILDGRRHRSYEKISDLCFAPNNNHLAYIAKRGQRFFLVYDGIEGEGYDRIEESSFLFSSNGIHYAFVGKRGDKSLVVTETGKEKAYDEIGEGLIKFSPDGQILTYPARVGTQWFLVVNGQESKAYHGIWDVAFSRDSMRLAAVVQVENRYSVLVDDEEGPVFPLVKPGSLIFSPDSRQIGYIAQDQGQEFIVIDHQVGNAYDRIISRQPAFSPDSSKIAYAAQRQEDQFVVWDGVEGKPYQMIMDEPPVISPNSRNLAYAAYDGTDWVVVLDSQEQTPYATIGKGTLTFSNRGSKLAYTAKTKDGIWTVVVDGLAGRYYDDIGLNSLTFSPDGRNVVYSARRGNKWLVVLDNEEGRLFDAIINAGNNQIRFKGSAFFYYSVLNGNKVVTIQERIASKSDFVDFQKDPADNEIPLDQPAKEFVFGFNPPDGIAFIETNKTVDSVQVEMMGQQLNEEEVKIRTEINKSATGYRSKHLILQYQVKDVEDPARGEALSVLEGVEFVQILDSNGAIIRFEGVENFDKRLKKAPAKYYRHFKDFFAKEQVEQRLRDNWKASVEDLNKKSFQIGDIWDSTAKLPLPNGAISDVSVAIEFKEETLVDSVPCVRLEIDYDLSSSNLSSFVSEIIKKGIPQLQTDPEVEISCKGESIVVPDTLLGFGGHMEMIIKALVEVPEHGKKEFMFKHKVEVTCEYL